MKTTTKIIAMKNFEPSALSWGICVGKYANGGFFVGRYDKKNSYVTISRHATEGKARAVASQTWKAEKAAIESQRLSQDEINAIVARVHANRLETEAA